jgi:hypothetical protein
MFENIDYKGLTGIIVTPSDPEYEEARQVYNRAIQKYPLAIVYCLTVWDVARAVKWARRNSVGFRIRGGGHNYEGYCVGNAVLVIDLSRLNAVRADPSNRTVTVQGGALNRDLLPFLAASGRDFPSGSCPGVGVAGYAMGGGWNYFCRCLGLGCDSLVSLRMVNWEGEILTASEDENPDLFWACRGGGDNNFGVAVSLTFKIPRKTGRVTYFTIYRPDADAAAQQRFLSAWQEWLPGLDAGMTLRPSLYNSAEEGRAIYSRGIFFGRPEEARRLLRPLIRSADMTFSAQYVTFARAVQILGSVYPPSEMFMTTGRFVERMFTPCEIERIVALLDERPEGVELIELGLFAMGGKVRCVPPHCTAFFYRNASYILAMQAMWTDPAAADAGGAWVAEAFGVIEPLTAGSFVNFPYDCLYDYEDAYYGGNVPRLRAVKTQYDPENVFRYPQSIRPL